MAVAYRRLRILTPSLGAYYGVVDEEYRPHELASWWLEVRFFGRAQAETTSAQYASSIALFLTWAHQSGRDLEQAARNLHLFAAYLATEPQRSGRTAGSPRTARALNNDGSRNGGNRASPRCRFGRREARFGGPKATHIPLGEQPWLHSTTTDSDRVGVREKETLFSLNPSMKVRGKSGPPR